MTPQCIIFATYTLKRGHLSNEIFIWFCFPASISPNIAIIFSFHWLWHPIVTQWKFNLFSKILQARKKLQTYPLCIVLYSCKRVHGHHNHKSIFSVHQSSGMSLKKYSFAFLALFFTKYDICVQRYGTLCSSLLILVQSATGMGPHLYRQLTQRASSSFFFVIFESNMVQCYQVLHHDSALIVAKTWIIADWIYSSA